MSILVIILPLSSAIISGLFGRKLGAQGSGIITSIFIVTTFIISCAIFIEVCFYNSPNYLYLWSWMDTSSFSVSFNLLFDQLTSIMLIVITSISSLVHIYSTSYMQGDPHISRFMSYLSLFTFFMIVLVTGNNLVQLFVGWEGVGLASYLLINFWYTRLAANKSAIKAMLVNRLGDAMLLLAMFLLYYTYNSLDYNIIFSLVPYLVNDTIVILGISFHTINVIGILLVAGSAAKSSQLFLHTWLPDAMEGPTPVSALIHAATMVTAGIYLTVRFSPLLEYTQSTLILITILGSLTCFFAGSVGLVQNDIKKVIAYSTCSQLGYMFFSCGVSNYTTGLFHLMNHAFFKALLFLSAGSIIHAMADEQDMRKYGGLIKSLPFTYSAMLIGSLSLMGFPFMTGFYSKDAILEFTYASYTAHSTFAYWLGSITAFMTAFYSFRLLYLTFLANPNATQQNLTNSHENPLPITIPLFILSFGAIFVGYIFKDAFIGMGSDFLGNSVYVHPSNVNIVEAEFLPVLTKWFPVLLSLLGAFSAFGLYNYLPHYILNLKMTFRSLYIFLSNKWHFDSIYNYFFVLPVFYWAHNVSYKVIDRGLLEYVGPVGILQSIKNLTVRVSSLQAGYVYNYALTMFIGSILLLFIINNINEDIFLISLVYLLLI